jgi:ribonuclease E
VGSSDGDEDLAERLPDSGEEKAAQAKEEGSAQARNGPRRRGRRGGRRGRAGQKPQQAPGDDAHGERRAEMPRQEDAAMPAVAEAVQDGGRPGPDADETAEGKPERRPPAGSEPLFETFAAASEHPPSAEPHAEAPGETEAPRRRGWWQR